jgi:antitoxin ParD1/3/4
MNVSLGNHFQGFVDSLVAEGRYGSASEVVREGLRLVEEREAKLQALRKSINDAIAEGGESTEEEIDAALDEVAEKMRRLGYAE